MSDTEVKILKTVWARSSNGAWHASALVEVELKPRTGDDPDFFEIKEGIFHAQPNHLGSIRFVFGQSIVPIVAMLPRQNVIRSLGTGFFISCTGLLVTAAHVISDPIERQYGGTRSTDGLTWQCTDLRLGVMIPTNPVFQVPGHFFCELEWSTFLAAKTDNPLPIHGVDLKLASDIAICKAAQLTAETPHQPLAIVQRGIIGKGMAVGKIATAVGYAGMIEETSLSPINADATEGDFAFNLHVSKGEILERFPDNATSKSVSAPGACFSAAARFPGGMSGSPIFDAEGIYVHGVVSKGWTNADGVDKFGYGSMIAPSMSLPIKDLGGRSLLDLIGTGGEGIARLSIPDA